MFVVNGEEVTEYTQKQLIAVEPKPEITYYFYRSQIPDVEPAACGRNQPLGCQTTERLLVTQSGYCPNKAHVDYASVWQADCRPV